MRPYTVFACMGCSHASRVLQCMCPRAHPGHALQTRVVCVCVCVCARVWALTQALDHDAAAILMGRKQGLLTALKLYQEQFRLVGWLSMPCAHTQMCSTDLHPTWHPHMCHILYKVSWCSYQAQCM